MIVKPLSGMTEDELIARAREMMAKAVALPMGGSTRAMYWNRFDLAMDELKTRAVTAGLEKLGLLRQGRDG